MRATEPQHNVANFLEKGAPDFLKIFKKSLANHTSKHYSEGVNFELPTRTTQDVCSGGTNRSEQKKGTPEINGNRGAGENYRNVPSMWCGHKGRSYEQDTMPT